MKKLFITTAVLLAGLFFVNLTLPVTDGQTSDNEKKELIPEDVQQVIDQSCFGCHNADSKNEKGKKKLQFDRLANLKTYQLVGKLADISDVVGEGDMPPAKAIEKYPDIKLTDADKVTLINWANSLTKELSGE